MSEPLRREDPQRLGRYRLIERLGQGDMGTVYLGQSEQGQDVVVRVMNPGLARNPHFRELLRQEVAAARGVAPFRIAPVLDASLDGHPLYVVTEYIVGPTLDQAVANHGPLPQSELDHLAVGVATALAAVHDAGILHRDLKPSSVLLSGTGPRVTGYGIARAHAQAGAADSGPAVATPGYQAPEALAGGPVTSASDVFSWGCVVAFAGTGRHPFPGGGFPEVAYRVANEAPRLEGLSPHLLPLVRQALDKDPLARPSVPQLLQGLGDRPPWTEEGPTPPPPPSTPFIPADDKGPEGRSRSAPLIGIGAFVVILAMVTTIAVVALSRGDAQAPAGGRALQHSASTVPATPDASRTPSTPPRTGPPAESSPDAGDVDPRFLGRWTGLITHHASKDSKFSALITITGGKLTQVVGESDYSSMGSHGTLKHVSATRTRLVVEERIQQGHGCEDVVLITLTYRQPRALKYEYELTNTNGAGMLARA
ncbi:serine/threonine-protein kinase [Actinomadura sp. BRA 177]|uniref:serine/threonine-protein kinase n=1 Tax=Actinomadura sp. BRA 177 TaxID=2745202 RepID=UPI0015954A7B|nr:serine/threonine-protein kinase [Actinomadura sp. BRA 177]NVI87459.1 serine/threonine protein kinase [Actinomadura sp. BRA 177]